MSPPQNISFRNQPYPEPICWRMLVLVLITCVSIAITLVAFYAPLVSFGFALVPFAVAICSQTRPVRFAWVAGYFLCVAGTSAWGLLQLGYPIALILAAGLGLVILVSAAMARIGVALTALLLLPIHIFPGNPLLAAGAVLPGTGAIGIFLLCALCIFIERLDRRIIRMALLGLLTALGNFNGLLVETLQPIDRTRAAQKEAGKAQIQFRETDIRTVQAITEHGYTANLAARMEPGGVYVTGENLVQSDDRGAITQWCRLARDHNLTVYLGVQDVATGQGQIRHVSPATCPDPPISYGARTGIPGLTGALLPYAGSGERVEIGGTDIFFLACFEAFSIWRWHERAVSEASARTRDVVVVTIARDIWTEPVPVGRLRRKIARQFERLLDVRSFHAEAGKTLLELP